LKGFERLKLGCGWGARSDYAIFNGYYAAVILSESCFDKAVVLRRNAVNNGEVGFGDFSILPKAPQFAGGLTGLGHDHDSAGFTVQPIDVMLLAFRSEVEAYPADQAGILIAFRRVAYQAGRFVDDQQIGILM
jgi:hypothetical protein